MWRQRYVSWIRAKKFRITDFFRKQDRDGDGVLNRSEFVDGMIDSRTLRSHVIIDSRTLRSHVMIDSRTLRSDVMIDSRLLRSDVMIDSRTLRSADVSHDRIAS